MAISRIERCLLAGGEGAAEIGGMQGGSRKPPEDPARNLGRLMKMGQSLNSLPLELRLDTYLRFSEESLHQAALTEDRNAKRAFLALAAKWRRLAADIEKLSRRSKSRRAVDEFLEEARKLKRER